MADLLDGITDDQLDAPTPCEKYRLGDLVEHIGGLAAAFTAAAAKDLGPFTSQAPSGDAARLGDDWRTRIPRQLAALAQAWREPAAWEGMTQVGGIELPAGIAGIVGLGEVVIHGWDVARATGQPYDADQQTLDACLQYVSMMASQDGGPFGPPVEVPDDAPLLDRIIGLSGRNPAWTAT